MLIEKTGSVFLLLFLSAGVLFGSGRALEFDDLLRARRISEPEVSPDGRRVAYVETTYDIQTHKSRSDIFIVPLAGGQPCQAGRIGLPQVRWCSPRYGLLHGLQNGGNRV